MTEPVAPLVIDPAGCGCTDCLTGESHPADNVPQSLIDDVASGCRALIDRSGLLDGA